MRPPNNPYLQQIRRDENRQMVRELIAGILLILATFLIVWVVFWAFFPAPEVGRIVEDNRGPALKKLYEQALRP